MVFSFTFKGHNDGMTLNPYTYKLWVMQNEDANPSLVVFDPETRQQQVYTFAAPPAAGGGYDDIAFHDGKAYISASNPANDPNNEPAIVQVELVNGQVVVVNPVLEGTADATDVLTGQIVALNLQDPDSMTTTPSGQLLLDSQADSELVLVQNPGTMQSVFQIPLSSPYGQPQVDDTIFTGANDGFILVSDTAANIIYKIAKEDGFEQGTPYTAGDAGGSATPGFVGHLDLNSGELTPIVSGLEDPHGMAFVPNGGNNQGDEDNQGDQDN